MLRLRCFGLSLEVDRLLLQPPDTLKSEDTIGWPRNDGDPAGAVVLWLARGSLKYIDNAHGLLNISDPAGAVVLRLAPDSLNYIDTAHRLRNDGEPAGR